MTGVLAMAVGAACLPPPSYESASYGSGSKSKGRRSPYRELDLGEGTTQKLTFTMVGSGVPKPPPGKLCPGGRYTVGYELTMLFPGDTEPYLLSDGSGTHDRTVTIVSSKNAQHFTVMANGLTVKQQSMYAAWSVLVDPDVTRSLGARYSVSMTVKGVTHEEKYGVDYSCITALSLSGNNGADGANDNGSVGAYDGGRGGNGGNFVAYATFVKTPDYPKLLAVRSEGGMKDFVLAPADKPFTVSARGGDGGRGGSGSNWYGRGSHGGDAGNGGDGGDGGSVTLVLDPAFPELGDLIHYDVDAGRGGSAGAPGRGGEFDGAPGQRGRSGRKGTFKLEKASVAAKFAGLSKDLVLLGGGGGGAAVTSPTAPKPQGGGKAPVVPTGTGKAPTGFGKTKKK